jgi:hypothetical protein
MLERANDAKLAVYCAWRHSELLAEKAQKEDLREQKSTITTITTGPHKGRSFEHVFNHEQDYTDFLLKKYLKRELSNPVLKDYVWYANRRRASTKMPAVTTNPLPTDMDVTAAAVEAALFVCIYVVLQFALCRPCPQ